MGTKKRPFYRIVAIDSRKPSSAPYLDNLGYFNPIEKPGKITAHEDLIFKWLDTGAQMSDTVASLFKQIGLTAKYTAKKSGQDVSEIEIKTAIIERPKKRKTKKKAD